MKVAVKSWAMHSDPGYRTSYGHSEVYLLDALVVARCDGDEESLYNAAEAEAVLDDEIQEQLPFRQDSGTCHWRGVTGTIEVPVGKIAVQTWYESICTNDQAYYGARILNSDGLKRLYQERAEHYARLAETI